MVKSLFMVIIMQKDLEKSVTFYESLGCELVFHVPTKWAELKLGEVKIGLCPVFENFEPHQHTGLVLEVEDLKESFEQYKAKEVSFINEPIEAMHGLMATFEDPSGNRLDLYQPTHDKLKKAFDQDGCCGSKNDGCQSGPCS